MSIDGKPLFKILGDSSIGSAFFSDSLLRWLGLMIFAIATILTLAAHRTLKVYAIVCVTLTVLLVISFTWSLQLSGNTNLFSPTTYADGPVFFSLGALLLLNTYITMLAFCTYMTREAMLGKIRKDKTFRKKGLIRYDWGGISDFDNPNGIDEFKLKFGGEKITYYNIFAGNTLLGKLAVTAMKLMKRVN